MSQYPAYKENEVEGVGEIPDHWLASQLKYLVDPRRQITYGIVQAGPKLDEGVPYIRPADMKPGGDVSEADLPKTSPEIAAKYERSRVEPEDLVVSIGPSFGKVMIVPRALDGANLTQGTARVAVADGVLDHRFAYWALQSQHAQDFWDSNCSGATFRALTLESLARTPIALPPLDEQRQLADYLDRKTADVDRLIQKKRALIARLGEQRAAVVLRAVTKGLDPDAPMKESNSRWVGDVPGHWTVPKIKFVARVESGHTPSRQHPEYWDDCTIPWVTLADVWQLRGGRTTVITETKEKISELGIANSSARLLPKGTVVLSRTASVGFSGILGDEMATSQDYVCWVCGPSLRPQFLLYVLRAMKGEFRRLLMGSTHKTIYMPDAYEFVTTLPPVDEQDRIVAYIEDKTASLDSIIDKETESVRLLTELRASLISEVVTGKIDVRGATLAAPVEPREVQDVNPFTLWVLANYVLNRMASADHFGRITLVKVLFALQYELRLRLTGKKYADPWQRWDFGPFNPKLVNALEASLDREGYWRKVQTGDDRQVRYEPKENASDPKGHFERYWGDRRDEIDAVLEVFEDVTSGARPAQRAEIVATLYGAWNDLLIAGDPFTDDDVVTEARENWHPSKLQVERERWHKALGWMRDHEFTPSGFGAPVIPREVAA